MAAASSAAKHGVSKTGGSGNQSISEQRNENVAAAQHQWRMAAAAYNQWRGVAISGIKMARNGGVSACNGRKKSGIKRRGNHRRGWR